MTSGHPFNTRFPWVLDDLGVGIQWGPADDMFPKGFVFRASDWSWRIENISGILTEVDSLLPPFAMTMSQVDQGMVEVLGGGGEAAMLADLADPRLRLVAPMRHIVGLS